MQRRPDRSPAARTAAVAAVLAGAFALLAAAVAARAGRPFPVDTAVHEWVLAHRSGGLTAAAVAVTTTGTGVVAYALVVAAGALAGGRNRWWAGAAASALVLALVELLRLGISRLLARARPPRADWLHGASGYAFPSGHTTTSAVVAAVVLVGLARRSVPAAVRAAAGCAAVVWALCVGVSRVYLGVHWPSDVVGGELLVLALALGALPLVRRAPA